MCHFSLIASRLWFIHASKPWPEIPHSSVCLLLLGLNSVLHGFEMFELVGVLTQAPGHDTSELLLSHNLLELACNHFRGVPGPEDVVLLVKVVLAAALVVGLAVLLGLAPRIDDRDSLASTVVGQATCLAEIITGTTRDTLVPMHYEGVSG